jgi:hypothetical protein
MQGSTSQSFNSASSLKVGRSSNQVCPRKAIVGRLEHHQVSLKVVIGRLDHRKVSIKAVNGRLDYRKVLGDEDFLLLDFFLRCRRTPSDALKVVFIRNSIYSRRI